MPSRWSWRTCLALSTIPATLPRNARMTVTNVCSVSREGRRNRVRFSTTYPRKPLFGRYNTNIKTRSESSPTSIRCLRMFVGYATHADWLQTLYLTWAVTQRYTSPRRFAYAMHTNFRSSVSEAAGLFQNAWLILCFKTKYRLTCHHGGHVESQSPSVFSL